MYKVAEEIGISPKELFQAVYLALLGQKSGPRLGYFLSYLEREFVVRRLRKASEGKG